MDGGDELRGLHIDGNVAAEQYAADYLPACRGCGLRASGHVSPHF